MLLIFSQGGENGHVGNNLLLKADGRIINLGGKTSVDVHTQVTYCFLLLYVMYISMY